MPRATISSADFEYTINANRLDRVDRVNPLGMTRIVVGGNNIQIVREERLDEDTRGSEWSFNVTVEYGSQTLQIAKANVEPQPMKDQIKFWLYTADVTEV